MRRWLLQVRQEAEETRIRSALHEQDSADALAAQSQHRCLRSIYLLYGYKCTHADAERAANTQGARGYGAAAGTQFTCFTRSNVHILTRYGAAAARGGAAGELEER